MNLFSPCFWFVLSSILFVNTERNGVSEAFLAPQYIIARSSPFRSSTSNSGLAFHPYKVEDSDFHTPAESFTFTRHAKAVISPEYVQSEWNEVDDLKRLSYLDVISSAAPVPNSLDQKQDTIYPDEPLAQAHRIQQAYREWCEFYGKIPNKERLGVFATNFLAVQEFHEKTGRPLVLNEFADLTEEEYRGDNKPPASRDNDHSITTKNFTLEDRILEAYRQWCDHYDRSYDEERLLTFASNFVVVEKYHLQTKESLALNEFADMTEQEFRKHLATAAHFTTPENAGPRANNDSVSLLQEQKEVEELDDDPITSYLDPAPSSTGPRVEELKPPITHSQTQIVQSNNKNGNLDVTSDTTELSDGSYNTNEALATLQEKVASLSSMVQSLATAPPPVAPQPTAQPLDSLVIDVLQQQDGGISQLEESIEGLHEIQMQSSQLIELVSNNQNKMTEMMEALQSKVAELQQGKKQVEEDYTLLLNRIEELEAVIAKSDVNDPVFNKSLVLSPATATKSRRTELKPKISIIGYEQRCYFP